MGAMRTQRNAQKKAELQVQPEGKGETPTKVAPNRKAAAKPEAKKDFKRKRSSELLQDETTRMTFRARLVDGSSKGFKYTSLEDMPRARAEAEAFMQTQKEARTSM